MSYLGGHSIGHADPAAVSSWRLPQSHRHERESALPSGSPQAVRDQIAEWDRSDALKMQMRRSEQPFLKKPTRRWAAARQALLQGDQ
jgi:hypothetical protein